VTDPRSPRRVSLRPPAPVGAAVRLVPEGLELATSMGPRTVPLYAGAMHYWRHAPTDWRAGLEAIRAMGLTLVDVYVPWGVHEQADGTPDFGARDPRLDVRRFLAIAAELGLYVILRPGPHINAELTHFGVPERILWDEAMQARSARGTPVLLPILPVSFPVPSYASEAFLAEVERWFSAVGAQLADQVYPKGPIVLVQVDNEGALYFRDGPYDQDYHPDAVQLFRQMLRARYRTQKALRAAWRDDALTFDTVDPPRALGISHADELAPHLDWMEFHEHLLATSFDRMARMLARAGFDHVPTSHNFPVGETVTALSAGRVGSTIDLLALDYYHRASPTEHLVMARRTTELANRCTALDHPAFGAEVGVGYPPFFSPIDEDDSLYVLGTACAYGLRGFNLYMAVERDRWVGAPIGPHGQRRPFADRLQGLIEALEAVNFRALTRKVPVRLVVPRVLRRLGRALHAFGSATPAMIHVLGGGYRESCFEDELGLGYSAPLEAEAFLRRFERALLRRGVPFAYVSGELARETCADAAWAICASGGGLKPEFVGTLRELAEDGVHVTLGPREPLRDGRYQPLRHAPDLGGVNFDALETPGRADALVNEMVTRLALPVYTAESDDECHVTVHEDAFGAPKVVFVMNPNRSVVNAELTLGFAHPLRDVLSGERVAPRAHRHAVTVPARSVRFFAVE
jgi:beta-galactosidase